MKLAHIPLKAAVGYGRCARAGSIDLAVHCLLRRRPGRACLAMVLLAMSAQAVPAAQTMYTDKQLTEDKIRYTQKFEFLYETGLRNFMTPNEKRALTDVVIRHPLRGATPLTVKSLEFEGVPTVVAPVKSLKFIEDLSVAYAWRYNHRYSLEPMDEYVAMLKLAAGQDPPGDWSPDPMKALGVPPKVWEREPQVDDLSLRFRNTAWAFILAHELGHLAMGHTQAKASPAEIQRQEEAADEFAVDLLGRSQTVPMGMILWFQATAGYMRNRSDFPSDAAYIAWVQNEASHPVNGARMRNLAMIMQRQAAAERDPGQAEFLNYIAERLVVIGETIEDPEMQQLLGRCAAARRPQDLKRLQDLPCP